MCVPFQLILLSCPEGDKVSCGKEGGGGGVGVRRSRGGDMGECVRVGQRMRMRERKWN